MKFLWKTQIKDLCFFSKRHYTTSGYCVLDTSSYLILLTIFAEVPPIDCQEKLILIFNFQFKILSTNNMVREFYVILSPGNTKFKISDYT